MGKNNRKILLLGIDGMDPRLTKKYVDMGLMPNTKKYIEHGACREDLVMLGGHPTVTPPMWTTLATGCYANVHGITGFFRKGSDIDEIDYNIDSRHCKAEPLWNVTAEAGLKTLVFHWPGSAWPPTSDSPNLLVVDGTTPGAVGHSTCPVDSELIIAASEKFNQLRYIPKAPIEASAACVIDDLDVKENDNSGIDLSDNTKLGSNPRRPIIWKEEQMAVWASEAGIDNARSPIKPATGWFNAPADAKEFTILFSGGLIRRPALILKNEAGIYDRVEIYKRKQETKPIAVCPIGVFVKNVQDEVIKDNHVYNTIRNIKLLNLADDGSSLTMHMSTAMDTESDYVWHPKRLFEDVKKHVGSPVPLSFIGRQDDMLITDCMLANWDGIVEYEADVILHLINSENLDIVFSHLHNIDEQAHMFVNHMADRPFNRISTEVAEKWMLNLYLQTDHYLGKFIHLLDENWTIIIFSDHGLIAPAHEVPPLVDMTGICTPLMEEMGYTVLKRDNDGQKIGEIDWTKTRAVLQREGHIYLNLKGREKHIVDGQEIDGIVDPADQYELEEQIMTDLYSLKSKETGHRIVSVALRNRDAVLLGQGGPEAGDIICWIAEGHNFDHGDGLSTAIGEADTSVSPIFIAAGPGIKSNYVTERIIREVDLVPTVAALMGVRMPAQCEGAPIYQILTVN